MQGNQLRLHFPVTPQKGASQNELHPVSERAQFHSQSMEGRKSVEARHDSHRIFVHWAVRRVASVINIAG